MPYTREIMISFDEYQEKAADTAIYKEDYYPYLGLISEVGELAALYKRWLRDGKYIDYEVLQDELGDVLWYLSMIAHDAGISLSGVAQRNIEKLASRKERGTLQGKGGER